MRVISTALAGISICALLSGCVPALVAGGAAGGYYLAKDKGPVGQYTDDSVITSKIKTKYVGDLALKSLGISVSTNHGIVSLVGHVKTHRLRSRAIGIAENTKGVRGVNATNLTVGQ